MFLSSAQPLTYMNDASLEYCTPSILMYATQPCSWFACCVEEFKVEHDLVKMKEHCQDNEFAETSCCYNDDVKFNFIIACFVFIRCVVVGMSIEHLAVVNCSTVVWKVFVLVFCHCEHRFIIGAKDSVGSIVRRRTIVSTAKLSCILFRSDHSIKMFNENLTGSMKISQTKSLPQTVRRAVDQSKLRAETFKINCCTRFQQKMPQILT